LDLGVLSSLAGLAANGTLPRGVEKWNLVPQEGIAMNGMCCVTIFAIYFDVAVEEEDTLESILLKCLAKARTLPNQPKNAPKPESLQDLEAHYYKYGQRSYNRLPQVAHLVQYLDRMLTQNVHSRSLVLKWDKRIDGTAEVRCANAEAMRDEVDTILYNGATIKRGSLHWYLLTSNGQFGDRAEMINRRMIGAEKELHHRSTGNMHCPSLILQHCILDFVSLLHKTQVYRFLFLIAFKDGVDERRRTQASAEMEEPAVEDTGDGDLHRLVPIPFHAHACTLVPPPHHNTLVPPRKM